MAGNYGLEIDQEDIDNFLITRVASFIQDRLLDKEQRIHQKEQCAERLAAEDGGLEKRDEIRYSDQAVLANLDWGIVALEEAMDTSNMETKMAQLDYAEKMLQVCAMLNSSEKTAGVPNFYLSAWAHLYLSYLWLLRNNVYNSVLHVLEMFIVDPFFSRIDFAPELWKSLFLPNLSSVVGWYTQERHRIVMDMIPDSGDLSLTMDFDKYFNESLILSVRPDQAEKMEKLEQLYGKSLDENTRLYARYYKDCMDCESSSSKQLIPMLPIVEPPVTPLHEVSPLIPDYIKFGPILPRSAGFSPVLEAKENAREDSRSNVSSACYPNLENSTTWDPLPTGDAHVENGYNSENEPDLYKQSDISMNNDVGAVKDQRESPRSFSDVDSPKTLPVSSPYPEGQFRKESKSVLRLMSRRGTESPTSGSLFGSPLSNHDLSISSADSDGDEIEQQKTVRKSASRAENNHQLIEKSVLSGSDEGSQRCISQPSSEISTPQSRPPKDFVCPITGQIFHDPVTLETGQTFERKAIEEWINRGNTTCPITRQPICATALPKTNYVLKRLISSWKEQHPDFVQELSYTDILRGCLSPYSLSERSSDSSPSRSHHRHCSTSKDEKAENKGPRFIRSSARTSPNSVISQVTVDTIIQELKPLISRLCTSEDLPECEASVLKISRIWQESKISSRIHSSLSSPTMVNAFVEILSASVNIDVLRTTIFILSELMFSDEGVGEILTSVDTDFDSLSALLINGLAEAAVLIYLLKPSVSQLSDQNIISSLIQIILDKVTCPDDLKFVIAPKDAALALLQQIIAGSNENSRSAIVMHVTSAGGIPALLRCIERVDGKQSAVSILLYCMRGDKSCRNALANRTVLYSVLDLFQSGSDRARGMCIEFLSELVQQSRRSLCNQILHIIKEGGALSTMHTLLVYLQMSPMDQKPAIASLLLKLDLLTEPRKMSVFREEAIESLIEALRRRDFPAFQLMALDALSSLSGHLTSSGNSCTGDWLLNIAGFSEPYNAVMKGQEQEINEAELTDMMGDEKKIAASWEKRLAFTICNHEKGLIFKAVKECLETNSIEITKSCLVIATWLVHMIFKFPDSGVRAVARNCLLDHFINILQSSKSIEEKILASLALRGFINDQGALDELGMYAKSIYRSLRKLKRHCIVANHIMKALMRLPSINADEFWHYGECCELDASMNGEVLYVLYVKGRIISSHSDGSIKVWDVGKRSHRLVQEVREHTKAVTCLYIPSSCDKLFSGSLDKTIRVWTLKHEEIHCIQVHDVKEPVLELTANSDIVCFTSQGTGVKVYNWSGLPKHVNFNKHVKCLALSGDKLYCGCPGYSIQEVDLSTQTSISFYSGTRKLLGKQSIYSLHIDNDLLIVAGSSVDCVPGKVFSIPDKTIIGSLSTGFDIHRINVNNDFILTASRCGIIEVWLKDRLAKVGSIKIGGEGHAKVTSIASDSDGDMLFAGISDGKIKIWNLH